MIVYKVTCLETNKVYVGITSRSLEVRRKQHVKDAMGHYKGASALHAAIRKYGVDAFVWDVVETVLFTEAMFELEKYYIEKFGTLSPDGYNLTIGGDGPNGYHHTRETRMKMSKTRKGGKFSAEHCRKISEAHRGMGHSEETRKKMSEQRSGTKHPNYGKHLSAETRKKIGDAQRGEKGNSFGKHRPVSDATRMKLSFAKRGEKHPNYGKPWSEELRAKMKLAQIRRRERELESQ